MSVKNKFTAIRTSPGTQKETAAQSARLSAGPFEQGSAVPTNRVGVPGSGLIRRSSAPCPAMASTMKPVGVAPNRSTTDRSGRSILRRIVRTGGSSIIGDGVADHSRAEDAPGGSDRPRRRIMHWHARRSCRSTDHSSSDHRGTAILRAPSPVRTLPPTRNRCLQVRREVAGCCPETEHRLQPPRTP